MSASFVPVDLVGRSGRRKVAEPTDPLEAVAVSFSTPGHDGIAAMGRVLVEEFAMLGWPRHRILRMFSSPRYAGAHAVWRSLGPDGVGELIDSVLGIPGEEG